jgi:endonuclease III
MKNGAEYAKRIKRLFDKTARELGKFEPREPTDPTEQLIISILSVSSTEERGRAAFRKLCDNMLDFNEIRVSTPGEVAGLIKDAIPGGLERARVLVMALNAIFQVENQVNLEPLRSMGRRDARRYLEELNGVEPYTVASVLLRSLGGHAIPVSNRLLDALRENDLVDPQASVTEVQSFLERHVNATDAHRFCAAMDVFVRSKRRAAQRRAAKRTAGKGNGRSKSTRRAAKRTKTSTAKKKKKRARSRH